MPFHRVLALGAVIAAGVIGGTALLILVLSSLTPMEAEIPSAQVESPIYVTILTHIEEPGPNKPDYLADEELFWEHRAAYVRLANFLHERGIPFDFQSDWNFLAAMLEWDTGDESTNGKNLVKWMHEDLGFSIDPHAHETTHNYADVAYLISALGVEPTNITGGMVVYPVSDSKLEYLRSPIQGNVYDYTWQADVVWGGGTAHHLQDDLVKASGVWRPKNSSEYFTHDPEGSLPNIGSLGGWVNVERLLALQRAGKLPPGLYTVHIMAAPEEITQENYLSTLAARIKMYEEDHEAGRLVWADLPTIIEDWTNIFHEEPSVFPLSTMEDLLDTIPRVSPRTP